MASSLFQNNQQIQSQINPQMINSFRNIMNMAKMQNPMQMIQGIAAQNPQVNQIMNMIQNSNVSPKDLFMKQAQQMGINPNDIINQLKQI